MSVARDELKPVVVDTSRSRCARLRPVPLTGVELADTFWAPRLRLNRTVTLPSQYRQLEDTGRIDNLRRAAGNKDISFRGYFFNDSDVYKWLEAVGWALAAGADAGLEGMAAAVTAEIAAAQQPDGYLNSYFAFDRAAERWTNLRDMHELYCAGHLIQAAIAHRRARGDERLLEVACRLADHICDTLGEPAAGKRAGTCGHPEIEMALVELARTTGDLKYQAQAQFFLDARGHGLIGGRPYHQDHVPFRDMQRLAGHAVRAAYLCAGAADLYAESGEGALGAALDRVWTRMRARQMYVSGGIGSRHREEAFGEDYELPNERAYAETCAAIGSLMWAWRMLALGGDARYADVLELALYNAVLAGISLDGQAYLYHNPLADNGMLRRQAWFECACCPPNIARSLAALPGYFYSLSDEGIWLHLYAEGSARLALPDGRAVGLHQHTRYPWDGQVAIEVDGQGEFSLFVRIPGWCQAGRAQLAVNNQPYAGQLASGSYGEVRRTWQPGDVLSLNLPMPARRVECHPYAAENVGRVALMRGPLLYCVEQVDNPAFDLRDVRLPPGQPLSALFCPDVLGGVVVLRCQAQVVPPGEGWASCLYRTAEPGASPAGGQAVEVTAIPYYAWANREPGPMQVWLRRG